MLFVETEAGTLVNLEHITAISMNQIHGLTFSLVTISLSVDGGGVDLYAGQWRN